MTAPPSVQGRNSWAVPGFAAAPNFPPSRIWPLDQTSSFYQVPPLCRIWLPVPNLFAGPNLFPSALSPPTLTKAPPAKSTGNFSDSFSGSHKFIQCAAIVVEWAGSVGYANFGPLWCIGRGSYARRSDANFSRYYFAGRGSDANFSRLRCFVANNADCGRPQCSSPSLAASIVSPAAVATQSLVATVSPAAQTLPASSISSAAVATQTLTANILPAASTLTAASALATSNASSAAEAALPSAASTNVSVPATTKTLTASTSPAAPTTSSASPPAQTLLAHLLLLPTGQTLRMFFRQWSRQS